VYFDVYDGAVGRDSAAATSTTAGAVRDTGSAQARRGSSSFARRENARLGVVGLLVGFLASAWM
jgi:hypothetical protein